MRNRRQASTKANPHSSLQAPAVLAREPTQVERIFRPEELDLDGLAEAVRTLLEHGGEAPHLLSGAPRGTHVVEATGTY